MATDDTLDAEVITPEVQDTVSFYGQDLVAVRLPDGRIAAVLRWLCEGLGVNQRSQMAHIRGRTALADGLVTVKVQTAGGPQSMPALTLDVLSGWLYTVDERRVREEARPSVVRFQRECARVLADHFAQRQAIAQPSSLVPSESIEKPVAPPEGASPSQWLEYHQRMIAFLEWQQDIEAWRDSVENRLESVEEISRLVPDLLERLGPAPLSPEHQQSVQALVTRLHKASGVPYGTIHSELREAFHVGTYKDIPESDWPKVARWFQTRIRKAEQRP